MAYKIHNINPCLHIMLICTHLTDQTVQILFLCAIFNLNNINRIQQLNCLKEIYVCSQLGVAHSNNVEIRDGV